jgi:formylglycine-generating enzyme required for sulfatase activity
MNFPNRCLAVLLILLVAGFLPGSRSNDQRAFAEKKPAESPFNKQSKKEKKEEKEAEKAKKLQAEQEQKAEKLKAASLAKEQEAKELAAIAEKAKQQQLEWAKKLKVPVETKSKSGIELVLIPPDGKAVPEPYWIGKYEITQTEWKIVKWKNDYSPNGPSTPSIYRDNKEEVRGMDTSQHPVEMVSWNWCIAFCNCLSMQEGLDP